MSLDQIFGLTGQHALVTGGGSGLGLAIAQCFVEAGANVTIVGTNAQKLASACETLGPKASSRVFDVTDMEGLPRLQRRSRRSPARFPYSSTMLATPSRHRSAK